MVYVLDAITSCADEIANDYGSWSEDPFAFEVLKGCVNAAVDAVPTERRPGSQCQTWQFSRFRFRGGGKAGRGKSDIRA